MGIIAVIVALAGLLAALANAGYLGLLGSVAKKRPGTAEITTYVRGRVPVAAGTTVGALLALLCTRGGFGFDVVAIILALSSGGVAIAALQGTRTRFATHK